MEMVKRRGRLTGPEVQFFMKQIISGVNYLHQNNVIHRDLKLGNLFLHDQLTIKVGDLGLAALLETEEERKRYAAVAPSSLQFLSHISCLDRTLCGTPVSICFCIAGVALIVYRTTLHPRSLTTWREATVSKSTFGLLVL